MQICFVLVWKLVERIFLLPSKKVFLKSHNNAQGTVRKEIPTSNYITVQAVPRHACLDKNTDPVLSDNFLCHSRKAASVVTAFGLFSLLFTEYSPR